MNQVSIWWEHSLSGKLWLIIQRWQQASLVISPVGLGTFIVVLIVLLPYLSNSQIGLLLLAISCFYFPLWHKSSLSLPFYSYGGVALVSTLLSPVRSAALDGLIKLVLYGVLYLAIHRVFVFNLRWRNLFVGSYLLTNILVSIGGLRQQFFGAQQLATWWDPASELSELTRVYSFLGNPNLLAGYLLPSIPLGIVALILAPRSSWKLLLGVVTLGSLLCIVYSYSRGAWLGLAAESLTLVLLLLYWRFANLPIWAIPGALIGMTLAMAGGVMAKSSIRVRIASIFSVFGDSRNIDKSLEFRLKVIQGAMEIVKNYPILGIGPGNQAFNQVYPLFQKVRHSALGAYSVPLELTIETGIVGLIVYLWLVVTALYLGWKSIVNCRGNQEGLWTIGGFCSLVGLMVHGLGDTVWYRPQVQILWWLAMALVSVELPKFPLPKEENH